MKLVVERAGLTKSKNYTYLGEWEPLIEKIAGHV